MALLEGQPTATGTALIRAAASTASSSALQGPFKQVQVDSLPATDAGLAIPP